MSDALVGERDPVLHGRGDGVGGQAVAVAAGGQRGDGGSVVRDGRRHPRRHPRRRHAQAGQRGHARVAAPRRGGGAAERHLPLRGPPSVRPTGSTVAAAKTKPTIQTNILKLRSIQLLSQRGAWIGNIALHKSKARFRECYACGCKTEARVVRIFIIFQDRPMSHIIQKVSATAFH